MAKFLRKDWQMENCLFPAKEMYLLSHDAKGRSTSFMQLKENQRRQYKVDNMHLIPHLNHTSGGMPVLKPYNGSLDFEYASYEDRNKHTGKGCALGFFLYDYKFIVSIWDKLEQTTHKIFNYDSVFAPDFSLFLDKKFEIMNRFDVYRSRFVGAYWQYCGLNVIPVASWGSAESFSYCFEGLPEYSIVAVCGIGHDINLQAHRLWCGALQELVAQKHPTVIIVYGGNPCTVEGIGTEIIFIKDYIHKKFRA